MPKRHIHNITILYDEIDEQTYQLVANTLEKSISHIQKTLDLPLPENCEIHIMTSPVKYIIKPATWPRKIFYILIFYVVLSFKFY